MQLPLSSPRTRSDLFSTLILPFNLALATLWAGAFASSSFAQSPTGQDENNSIADLEARIATIETELEQLARPTITTGVGSIGIRTMPHEKNNSPEWIEIDLGEPQPIDQIILVPSLRRDAEGIDADAFPLEFRILAGTGSGAETQSTEIAAFDAEDELLPRIAPVVVPCNGITASWIRVEISILSPRGWDGRFEVQLSEILVFNGAKNVALHRPVRLGSSGANIGGRQPRFLTDGFTPYFMDAAGSDSSVAFVSWVREQPALPYNLTIDLGKAAQIDGVHLHAIEISDNIPQVDPPNLGIPRRMAVEASQTPDFRDSTVLFEFQMREIFDAGPIIMRRFEPTTARYVRFVLLEAHQDPWGYNPSNVRLGFAEIEVFAKGENVALGCSTRSNQRSSDRPLSALTDGLNLYGKILPVRDWLNQLARRHDLERELPKVQALLQGRYEAQQRTLTHLQWTAGILVFGILAALIIDRLLRQRAVFQARERIAADLHDELGANLHAIGLIGELATDAKDSPVRLEKLLDRLKGATARTIDSARYCINLLEAKQLGDTLAEDIHRSSGRILTDLEHEIVISGEEYLQDLKPRIRLDLFLFYKESLINIIRHANATRVVTKLSGTAREITLRVTDNGLGLDGSGIPPSLRRRSRLLGGRVTAEPQPDGNDGLLITLRLRTRTPWPFSLL